MSETDIIVKIHPDGSLYRLLADGSEVAVAGPGPLRPMSDAEVEAAAASDPDAKPLDDAGLARMKPVPRARTLRRALGLTQEAFAARYRIPLGTLRDWEQGRTEPDQPARAYLTVIARDPEGVFRLLQAEQEAG
jgi:putative transcriptional regulator